MIFYSSNGSRIPNPYVDNAQPGPGHTYATISGTHVRVITQKVGGPGKLWCAWPEGFSELIGYGYGPSDAIGNLDRKLSE